MKSLDVSQEEQAFVLVLQAWMIEHGISQQPFKVEYYEVNHNLVCHGRGLLFFGTLHRYRLTGQLLAEPSLNGNLDLDHGDDDRIHVRWEPLQNDRRAIPENVDCIAEVDGNDVRFSTAVRVTP